VGNVYVEVPDGTRVAPGRAWAATEVWDYLQEQWRRHTDAACGRTLWMGDFNSHLGLQLDASAAGRMCPAWAQPASNLNGRCFGGLLRAYPGLGVLNGRVRDTQGVLKAQTTRALAGTESELDSVVATDVVRHNHVQTLQPEVFKPDISDHRVLSLHVRLGPVTESCTGQRPLRPPASPRLRAYKLQDPGTRAEVREALLVAFPGTPGPPPPRQGPISGGGRGDL